MKRPRECTPASTGPARVSAAAAYGAAEAGLSDPSWQTAATAASSAALEEQAPLHNGTKDGELPERTTVVVRGMPSSVVKRGRRTPTVSTRAG